MLVVVVMMTIRIQGLSEGSHDVEEQVDVSVIQDMFPEFFGMVSLTGTIQKIRGQFVLRCTAQCMAHLLCDRSGEEFDELVSSPIDITFIADTERYLLQQKEIDPEPPLYIREDDRFIDLTEEVRQQLVLAIPMKRVAPQYRDKDFYDIIEYQAQSTEGNYSTELQQDSHPFIADDRWSVLQTLKFDTNGNSLS
jgi:uncharacterized protein